MRAEAGQNAIPDAAQMTAAAGRRPPIRRAAYNELSPVVHWAQKHRRDRETFHISRRIYDFELLYIIDGLVRCRIGRESETFLLGAGQLVLLPAGMFHEMTIAEGEGADFLGVHFDFFGEQRIAKDEDIIVDEARADEEAFGPLPDIPEWGGTLPYRFETAPPHVVPLLETVIHEFTQKPLGFELRCKGALLEIIALLYRSRREGRTAAQDGASFAYAEPLRRLVREIENDCAGDWSNERLAKRLNVHSDYMARLFKRMTGMNPKTYVQRARHLQAKRLLRESEEKVRAIGMEVGYADPTYFCRVFKKLEGISPERYRHHSRIL